MIIQRHQSFLGALVFGLLSALLIAGCGEGSPKVSGDEVDQGIIHYKVTYPYLDTNDIGLKLLPQQMTMTFNKDLYRVESEGGMGLFLGGFVSHGEKQTMDYFMKIIGQKMVSRFTQKSMKQFHHEFPAYRLEFIDSTKTIAGLPCRGAKVIFFDNIISDYIIWYTDKIQIINPNWCSPFPKIEGVMLEYIIQRDGLVIHFEANEVIPSKIDPSVFTIPLDYKVVSNKKLIYKMEEAFMGFDY
ncbi:hypothetical protein KFE98_12490 [bacterium SCSIO 12741]|nr:hypothetical protein KFE98_12490 [bacterium SCSIO 12741]